MPFSILCGGTPVSGQRHTGTFVIQQGEQWSKLEPDGTVLTVDGPKTLLCLNNVLEKRQAHVANEREYLEVRFRAGHSEVVAGPVSLFEDPTLHASISCRQSTSINNNQALVVYREEPSAKGKVVKREVVFGPVLYKPRSANEWTHKFVWHGHDPSAGDLARKRPGALKFETLMLAPSSTYYDVENVRTADDALLTIRLMIFYRVADVEKMMDSTNDPIADIVNSVSSDVISFCSARSFEQFKETSEQLNSLGAFQSLVETVASRGLEVSKVVFRGYLAPQRLQKMHDEAIERRTKLVLERESELQEQELHDERLTKEGERDARKRRMAKEKKVHEAEMQRATFEATQLEKREAATQETTLQQQRQDAELRNLMAMQTDLGLKASDVATLLVARANGPPARLIQIAGECKPVVQVDGA